MLSRISRLLVAMLMVAGAIVGAYYLYANSRSLLMAFNRPFSAKFPYPRKDFLGREEDVKRLIDLLDFSNNSYEIICVVGPPGIGKSSLAIFAGNEMILNGAVVHYVNMAEFPNGQLKKRLAEKIYQNLNIGVSENITFDMLLTWASNRYWNNLIVLDNCDECINSQKHAFQEAVEEILYYSHNNIKFLVTSREETVFLEHHYVHKVLPLSEVSACALLDHKIPLVLKEMEKKRIAELTDQIPLALQIIGSLLGVKVAPPTPEEIIARLESNPLPTLSSPKLSVSMELSIGLSYNYLNANLQKLGRYIAWFPGSFDKKSFVNMLAHDLSSNNKTPIENQMQSLNELVSRSLLEYNERTGRYHFHRLIKEFFLLKGDSLEMDRFVYQFNWYHGDLLCTLTNNYIESPKEALATLDIEHHNIQFLLTSFAYHYFTNSITCFHSSMFFNYLSNRFSLEELIAPVRSTTNTLEANLLDNSLSHLDFDKLFTYYVDYIVTLSSLTEALEGREQAVEQFRQRVNVVEMLQSKIPSTNKMYTLFYIKFLRYESELDEKTVKLYHERILAKTKDSSLNCTIGWCDYHHIGSTYFNLRDYEKSIRFYEKAVDTNEYNELLTAGKINILLNLRTAYLQMHSTSSNMLDKYFKMEDKLLDIFTSAVNESSSLIYNMFFHVYDDYVHFLSQVSESGKAAKLVEKIYQALLELGKKDTIQTTGHAQRLAKMLYMDGDSEGAAKMASYALESLESTKQTMTHDYIGVCMILSKSTYLSGNYSEANKLFVNITEFLLTSNLSIPYTLDFTECCWHLLYLENYHYIHTCSSPILRGMFEYIDPYLQAIVFVVFHLPFDNIVETSSEPMKKKSDLPIEVHPWVIQSSKSTDVLFTDKKAISPPMHADPLFHLPLPRELILTLLKDFQHDTINNMYIRFVLNIGSVWIRLVIGIYFVKCSVRFLFWCIKIAYFALGYPFWLYIYLYFF